MASRIAAAVLTFTLPGVKAPLAPVLPSLAVPKALSLPQLAVPAGLPAGLPVVSAPASAQGPAPAATAPGALKVLDDVRSRRSPVGRRITVYLPAGYETSGRRYPVLYVHDGQNMFDPRRSFLGQTWRLKETVDRLVSAGRMEPVIIVALENVVDRNAELNPFEGGPKYADFLIKDLKPDVDQAFRTRPGAEDTATLGSSLGGLLSLDLALRRPDVFGRAAVISPSLWLEDRRMLRELPAGGARARLWASMGTREGDAADHAENAANLVELARLLQERGWTPGVDLAARLFEGGEHTEAHWANQLEEILVFLFPPRP